MKKFIITLCCLPVLAFSQIEDSIFIKKISDEILVNGKAYEWLHHLTKNIGNRLTASPNYYKAVDWSKQIMQQFTNANVYLQPCNAVHWIRGNADAVSISAINNKKENIPLNALALGNSLAGNATAPIIALKNFDELEKRKDEVKGKIVFFNYAFNPTYIEPFRAYGEAGKYRGSGTSRAAKYGAVGCIIRSLSGGTDNFPHTGMMKYNDSFPIIPCAALGLQDADKLWNTCAENVVRVSIATHGKFLKDTVAYNVIAEIKGSESNEIITIGGHLDSWDVGEGAHDDGAGVVQTMQVLQAFAVLGYKPKHTIRFVLFANEENGLAGGKKYAEDAVAKNEKHLLAIETDAGGFAPRGFGFEMKDSLQNKIIGYKKLLLPYGCYHLETEAGGADISVLHNKLNTPIGELLPDPQRYFDYHHTNADVFESVNKRELLLGSINMAALVYLVDKKGL